MDPSSCLICSFSGPGLHRFPRDRKRLKDWLVAIERIDLLEREHGSYIAYNSGRVCNAHFDDSYFCGKDKKKLAKNAIPSLSSVVKKSTTKKTPKTKKKSATKNKSTTSTSKNTQECIAEGDNIDVSEKSLKVNVEKTSSFNMEQESSVIIEKESSVNIEKEHSVNIEQESSVNIEKEPSVNIEKEPSVNIEKEPSVNIEKEPSVNIEKEPSVNIEKEPSVNIENESSVIIENSSIQKEHGDEMVNNQPTWEERKTKNVNPVDLLIEENIANAVNSIKEPEKIIGATKASGELLFLVKWKGVNEADLLPSTFVRKQYSEILIQFYEERLEWRNQ